jgi:hypothetical protein
LLLDIFSEVVGQYTQELNKLAHEILEMLCEGLGLNQGYFIGGLSENPQVLAHHYPPNISFPTPRNSSPPPGFPLLPLRKKLGKRVPKELFSYPPRHTPYNVNFLGERVPRNLKTSVNFYRGVCI